MMLILLLCCYLINATCNCDLLYENRQFLSAINCSEECLASAQSQTDSIHLLEISSLSKYLLEDYSSAAESFDRILALNPFHKLDSMNIPPEIIALFEGRRTSRPLIADHQINKIELLPFGVGHITGGKKRGWIYAGIAIAGLGVNIGSYYARESNKLDNNTYIDGNRAALYYNLQQGAFYGLFITSGVASLIDAFITTKDKR
jgi:hypothetical protein